MMSTIESDQCCPRLASCDGYEGCSQQQPWLYGLVDSRCEPLPAQAIGPAKFNAIESGGFEPSVRRVSPRWHKWMRSHRKRSPSPTGTAAAGESEPNSRRLDITPITCRQCFEPPAFAVLPDAWRRAWPLGCVVGDIDRILPALRYKVGDGRLSSFSLLSCLRSGPTISSRALGYSVARMGRGAQRYLSYTALVLLSAVSYTTADLWTVDIDNGPAPSPEDGPPFSAHATRDRAQLPYEVVGIVGSYIGTVIIIGTLLLTVGRRLRRRALSMATTMRGTEMVKPMNTAFDPSPISPVSSRGWYSPRRNRGNKSAAGSVRSGTSNAVSPEVGSVVSFDANVIEADKQKRQDEMERLYAAVMAQDERRSPQPASASDIPTIAPPVYSRKRPPRLLTDAPNLKHLQPDQQPTSPRSPLAPKSPIRAIYPPDSPMPAMPVGPTSPIRAEYPAGSLSPAYPSQAYESQMGRERATSFGSTRTVGSSSNGKRLRKSLRSLKISPSIVTEDNSDGARTPLSPRFYADPGIPPEPPTARTTDTMDSQAYPPTTPGIANSWRYGAEERLDHVRDLPNPAPQRAAAYNYNNQPQAVTNTASTRPHPVTTSPPLPPPPPRPSAAPALAASVNNALPFRQYAQSPHYPFGSGPISAGPTKTTFVESRRDRLMAGTPRTDMATPYSPYMPFTPLTPVTPHLTSRAERRQREREERAIRGAITEEDAVVDEGEMWSSGY